MKGGRRAAKKKAKLNLSLNPDVYRWCPITKVNSPSPHPPKEAKATKSPHRSDPCLQPNPGRRGFAGESVAPGCPCGKKGFGVGFWRVVVRSLLGGAWAPFPAAKSPPALRFPALPLASLPSAGRPAHPRFGSGSDPCCPPGRPWRSRSRQQGTLPPPTQPIPSLNLESEPPVPVGGFTCLP